MGMITFIDGAPIAVPNLERLWSDPAYAREIANERDAMAALFARSMAPHDNRQRAQREAMWAADEARARGETPKGETK